MKIYIEKINSYEFEGFIYDDQLPDWIIKKLNIDQNTEFCQKIEVYGIFEVTWDDDIAMPQITNIEFNNVDISLDKLDNDFLYNIEEEIATYGLDWLEDRYAYESDMIYDYLKEG